MGRMEWERGTIVLPSAAVAPLKAALRHAANAHHDRILATATALWTGPLGRTSSPRLYAERLETALSRSTMDETTAEATWRVMVDIVGNDPRWTRSSTPPRRPRAPRAADVERVAPRASVRSVTFGEHTEWSIIIDGTKLRYDSGENKYQVERARAHPVVAAMIRALDTITWTRGSGGAFLGNDEYHRESDTIGGGGNYIRATWGPRGEEARALEMGMSVARYRAAMSRAKQAEIEVRRRTFGRW